MNESFVIPISGFTGVLAYVWLAGYIWHCLPDEKAWWTFPAMLTTGLLGVFVFMFAAALGLWAIEKLDAA